MAELPASFRTVTPGGATSELSPTGLSLPVIEQRTQVTPEKALEQKRAKPSETGLDPEMLERLKKKAELKKIEKTASENPSTKKFLEKKLNLEVAQNNVEELSIIEQVGNAFKQGRASVEKGLAGHEYMDSRSPEDLAAVNELTEKIQRLEETLPESGMSSFLTSSANIVGSMYESLANPITLGFTATGAGGGAAVGAATGPGAIATSITGAGLGFIAGSGVTSYQSSTGETYLNMIEAGVPHDEAVPLAQGAGLIMGALEMVGATGVGKPLSEAAQATVKKGIGKKLKDTLTKEGLGKVAKDYSLAVGSEVATETMQEGVQLAFEDMARANAGVERRTDEEHAEQILEAATETFKGMLLLGVPGAAANARAQRKLAKKAESEKAILDDMQTKLKESSLPDDVVAEHVAEVLKDRDVKEVVIEPEGFLEWLEQQPDKKVIIGDLGVADQVKQAEEFGTDIVVPTETYTATIMPREDYSKVSEHVRTDIEGLSPAQAKDGEEIAQTIEESLADAEDAPVTEIDSEIEVQGLKELFKTADEAGFTERQYATYVAGIKEAKSKAFNESRKRELTEKQKEESAVRKKARARIEQQETEALKNTPVYASQTGLGVEKLHAGAVRDLLAGTDHTLVNLPRLNKQSLVSNDGKVDPELYAELHGYESGLAMVEDWIASPNLTQAVKQRTTERYNREVRKTPSVKKKRAETQKDLHNDNVGNTLTMELNAIRTQLKQKTLSSKLIKDSAKATLLDTKIRITTPAKYMAAARRNAKQARKALRKGDLAAASKFKFKQVTNFRLAQEAFKIRDKINNQRSFLAKFQRNSKQAAAIPAAHLSAIRELLDSYNLDRTLGRKKSERLSSIVNDSSDPVLLDDDMLDTSSRKFWKDITNAEFQKLHDAVKTIQKRGLEEDKLSKAAKTRELSIASNGVANNIRNNLKANPEKAANKWQRMKENGRSILGLVLNMDTITRQIDGFKDFGAAQEYIKRPFDRAMNSGYREDQIGFLQREHETTTKISELFSVYDKKEKKQFRKKQTIPGVSRQLTKEEQLMVLLNSGNEGNITALVKSQTLTPDELTAVQQHATKKDWEFVQSVWDYFETFWPEVKATEERRNNVAPGKVDAKSIVTPHGTFRGGYFPIAYDKGDVNARAVSRDIDDFINQVKAGGFVNAYTRAGHTRARTAGIGSYKLNLDTGVIFNHAHNLVFDLELKDALTDVYKVLNHKEVKTAFAETGNGHLKEQTDLWIKDLIEGEARASRGFEGVMRTVRAGFTVNKLGFNVGVSLIQVLGLGQSAVMVGKANMAATILKGPFMYRRMARDATQMSGLMKTRNNTWSRDIIDAKQQLASGYDQKRSKLIDFAFLGIKTMQGVVDNLTFHAALKQGMKTFDGDIDRAVEHAERMVVRTQSSGVLGDRSSFERGTLNRKQSQAEWVRAFGAFSSYFITKNNIAFEKFKKKKSPAQMVDFIIDMMVLYFFEGAMLTLGAIAMGREEDEDAVKQVFNNGTNTFIAGIPFFRDAVAATVGFNSSGVFTNTLKTMTEVGLKTADGDFDEQWLTKTIDVGSTFAQIPGGGQINKIIRAANKEEPELLDFFLGPKYEGR